MLLSKRLWAVLLVAVLIAGLLVGFGDGDEAVAKEPRATLGKIMIGAAAFIPTSDSWEYNNNGAYLETGGGIGTFAAPLWFPVPVVNIRKITVIAVDNSAPNRICVTLYRAQPLGADESNAGMECTDTSSDVPQKAALTAISPRRVNTVNQGPYLWASIGMDTKLYGVQVVYSY